MRPHGTLARYSAGCRRECCRAAMADYCAKRRRAKKGKPPPTSPPREPCIPRGWLIAADYPEMVRA